MTGMILAGAAVVRPDGIVREALHTSDGRIASASADARSVDLAGHVIFPGLVNAHDHLQLNCVPPLRRSAPFPNSYAWAAATAARFGDADVAAAVGIPADARHYHGGLKNLLSGATTVAHHDPWHPALDNAAFPVRLLRRFGWCHSLGLAPPDGTWRRRFARLGRAAPFLRLARPARYGPAVVASFTATPPDAPWMIHLAEGTDTVAASELPRLDALGCLAGNTVAVHGVGLGDADVDRIVARGAGVVWCPASNLALLGATLRPRRLFAAGKLALGTDSRLSGSRDLLDELRVAASCGDLSPAELLRLVTADAARMLAMADVGALVPGAWADFVVVRDTGANPYEQLLAQRRGDVRAVFRDGEPAIADPDLATCFDACGVPFVRIVIDGRPKLLARRFARPDAMSLEPGLAVD